MRYMHNEWNEEKKDEYLPFSPLFITNTSTGNWGENVFLFVYVVMSKQSAYHSTSILIRISFLGRCVHVELEITLEYWIFELNEKSSLLSMKKKIVIRIILIISNILVFMSMTQTHKIKAAIKRHRFSQYVHFPSNIILMACIKFQGYFHIK